MSRLLPVTGKQMCRILERLGFIKVHQSGSHIRYIHPDGRRTVVPVHDNEKPGYWPYQRDTEAGEVIARRL